MLWSIARAHDLGSADAMDVVQTTWLRLVEHVREVRDPDRVGAWLAVTARRESLRVRRLLARERPGTPAPTLAGPHGGAVLGGRAVGARAWSTGPPGTDPRSGSHGAGSPDARPRGRQPMRPAFRDTGPPGGGPVATGCGAHGQDPLDLVVAQERRRRLVAAIARLPERCRRLIRMLTTVPPASYVEISAALDMPVGSIGPTRARCLAQIRKRLAGRKP